VKEFQGMLVKSLQDVFQEKLSYMKNIFKVAKSGKLKTKHDNKTVAFKPVNKTKQPKKTMNKARKK
jgi:hypothetical protein